MTRIVAGELGGRRLGVPPGQHTRPTSDRTREGLFGTLGTLTELAGARFADLYAGSGAVGLEAISRGAEHALLVESHAKAVRTIRDNVAKLDVADRVQLMTAKVEHVVEAAPPAAYNVIFADPPYELKPTAVAELQRRLLDHDWLAPDGVLVLERSSRDPELEWEKRITGVRVRRYGETMLWYGRRS